MFSKLSIMNDAQIMAKHAAARQSLVAENIANADTPGYKSRDLASFKQVMQENAPRVSMRASRPGHMAAADRNVAFQSFTEAGETQSPNGNSVEVQNEILKSVEAERQHSRAITIYQASMKLLKTSIGKGR